MKTLKKIKFRSVKTKLIKQHKAKQAVRKNRPVHHRFFLHPITAFLLLCVGVSIVNLTLRAQAGQYTITAKVSAATLTDAATLDEPTEGQVFTTSPIRVTGTCPDDSYVVLYRNAAMSGVAVCSTENTYDIETSLYPNYNILKIQAFNLTDDAGPLTPEITVVYLPPAVIPPVTPTSPRVPNPTTLNPATSTTRPGEATTQNVGIPLLTSLFNYQTFITGEAFTWVLDVAGGKAPYQIKTEWGDGTSSLQTVSSSTSLQIAHQYKKAGVYAVKVVAVDAAGNQSMLQLVAVIKDPVSLITATNALDDDGQSILSSGALLVAKNWLLIVWGTYVTVLLMSISFWLGEQQKIHAIVNARHTRSRYKRSH